MSTEPGAAHTDKAKREMFSKLAQHLDGLADEVEKAIASRKTSN
jgi:hypothetical protein